MLEDSGAVPNPVRVVGPFSPKHTEDPEHEQVPSPSQWTHASQRKLVCCTLRALSTALSEYNRSIHVAMRKFLTCSLLTTKYPLGALHRVLVRLLPVAGMLEPFL